MKNLLMTLAAAALLTAMPAQAEDAQGYWSGSIAGSVPVTVHFNKPATGDWEATLSAPTQNLVTRVDDVTVTPDSIGFALRKLDARYRATWNDSRRAWVGTWTQGRAAPLVLVRTSADALTPKRPQEQTILGRAPGYRSSDVSFANEAAKVTLAGTLSVPDGTGPFPAVVLVHGSGPINRDGDVFGHRPYLVLADHLNRKGIAVLRYDKRGVGKSSGKHGDATTADLADDAEAALRFLHGQPRIDAGRIGIVGHSEGGLIAPMVAARDPKLAFLVLLAAPGVRGDIGLLEQLALAARALGVPEAAIARDRTLQASLFAAMVATPDVDEARRQASAILAEAERKGEVPAGAGASLVKRFGTPWFHALLRHDPAPALQAVRQPVLVLGGERDLQVPPSLHLPALRTALRANPQASVKELPALNHLFQTARSGAVSEYAAIDETMAPAALEAIGDWIMATTR
jgi:pimeloyl-ACP methyl ester carboxylesterase